MPSRQDRTSFKPPSKVLEDTYPLLKTLTRRQLELMHLKGVSIPDHQFRVMDLSQNLAFCNLSLDKIPCITPDGVKLLTQQVRLITAVEYLRLQGIWMNEDALQKYSGSFLQDLAGNAFETSACAANFLCGMIFMAQNFACQEAHAAPPERPLFAHELKDHEDDDDSEIFDFFLKSRKEWHFNHATAE